MFQSGAFGSKSSGSGSTASWALRCHAALEAGDFVAPLVGRLVAAQQVVEELAAEGVLPAPPEVVLLNHFFGLWEVWSRAGWRGKRVEERG